MTHRRSHRRAWLEWHLTAPADRGMLRAFPLNRRLQNRLTRLRRGQPSRASLFAHCVAQKRCTPARSPGRLVESCCRPIISTGSARALDTMPRLFGRTLSIWPIWPCATERRIRGVVTSIRRQSYGAPPARGVAVGRGSRSPSHRRKASRCTGRSFSCRARIVIWPIFRLHHFIHWCFSPKPCSLRRSGEA